MICTNKPLESVATSNMRSRDGGACIDAGPSQRQPKIGSIEAINLAQKSVPDSLTDGKDSQKTRMHQPLFPHRRYQHGNSNKALKVAEALRETQVLPGRKF